MSSPIDTARQQGYSDEEIEIFLSQQDPKFKKAVDSGYSLDEISEFHSRPERKPEESFGRGLARTAHQAIGGALSVTGLGLLGELSSLIGTGEALAELPELQERLPELKEKFPMLDWPEKIDEENYLQAVETAQKYSPTTVSGLENIIEDLTGTPLTPKTRGQRLVRLGAEAGKFAPKGIIPKTTAALGVPDIARNLEELGVPEDIADTTALGLSLIRLPEKAAKPPAPKRKKPPPEKPPPTVTKLAPAEKEKLPSGLTKLKITEREPGLAQISSAHQKRVINRLNEEASELTKKTLKKRLPISKQLEEGIDFEKSFQKGFGEIEKSARKAKPFIETEPLSKYFSENAKKYRGISPSHLSQDERKIMKYIDEFRRKPFDRLDRALTVFRSNNNSISRILGETKGFETPYVRFLRDVNKEITKSFEMTFPKDSPWVNNFKRLNEEYSFYQKAKELRQKLRPLIKGEPTYANLVKIAEDPKISKRLRLALGEEGAKEIRQIAEDLRKSVKAVKSIPKETLKELDFIYPLKLLGLPFYAAKKLVGLGRKGIGVYLTTPAIRKSFDSALKAIEVGNVGQYKKATDALKKDLKLVEHKPKISELPKQKEPSPSSKERVHLKEKTPKKDLRKLVYEEKLNNLEERLKNAKEREIRLEKEVKDNPKSSNSQVLLKSSQHSRKQTQKLLDQLRKEGEGLISGQSIKNKKSEILKQRIKHPTVNINVVAAKYEEKGVSRAVAKKHAGRVKDAIENGIYDPIFNPGPERKISRGIYKEIKGTGLPNTIKGTKSAIEHNKKK